MSVMAFDLVLQDENFTANLTCTPINGTNNIKIKKQTNKSVTGDVVIPETITYNDTEYTVVELEASAFAGVTMTSIVLPETVTKIGSAAFNQSKLKSITFPSSLAELPQSVCEFNSELTTVVLPREVQTIGKYAFRSCSKLENVTYSGYTGTDAVAFPEALITLKEKCFSNTAVREVIIPDNITEIELNAFSLCENLVKIHFPETMTLQTEATWWGYGYLNGEGKGLCDGCTSLKEANIPSNWAWIPTYMFHRCTSLESIEIPENIKCIGKGAFQDCTALTQFIMTNNEEMSMPDYIDEDEGLSLPAGFGMIEVDAFNGCTSLQKVKLSKTTYYIAEDAFLNCTSLTDLELNEGLDTFGPSVFMNCSSLETVKLPHTLGTIGDQAFFGCTALTEIDIPNSVFDMGDWGSTGAVFGSCTALKSVRLSNELPVLKHNMFKDCTSLTELCFPPSMEEIEANVISGCQNLKNVYIGLNVTDIAANAFANSGMTDLFITAQTPPAVAPSSFPESLQRLHVQREKAQNLYATTDVWKDYTELDLLIEPDSVVILQDPAERPGAMRAATTQYNTATQIFAIQGDKFSRTATMQGENASIPHLFWKSEDPATAYVDNDGNIHVRGNLYPDTPVKVKAQSLYADMPLSEVTVLHESMSGIGEVSIQLPEGADSGATHIFTLGGIYMGTSLRGLQPGIYLIRTGNSTSKISVN